MFWNRPKRDDSELTERVGVLEASLRDMDQRFKVIEREHDDLHRAYRRLRSSGAAEARESNRSAATHDPGGNGDDPPRPATKDELRRQYLVPGRVKRELPQQG